MRLLPAESGVGLVGWVANGIVKGDLHDIGKNLMSMMMVGAGLEVVDMGVDNSLASFAGGARRNGRGCYVSPLDHRDAFDEDNGRNMGQGGITGQCQGPDWRRARQPGICRPDWRGWLCARC